MAKLKEGAKGKPVEELQTKLNKTGKAGTKLKVDGYFGPKTLAGVKTYQKFIRVKVDGVAGPATLGALDTKPGSVQLNTDDPIGPSSSDKADIDKIEKDLKGEYGKVEGLLKDFGKALSTKRKSSGTHIKSLQSTFVEYGKMTDALSAMLKEFEFANQWNGPRAKEIATEAKTIRIKLKGIAAGAVNSMKTLKADLEIAKKATGKLQAIKDGGED